MLATTGVIIGVAALVAAFAITDGVDVWSRALIARESSVQDVATTPRTREVVRGRSLPVHGNPTFSSDDAARAGAEVPGVVRHALMLNGSAPAEYLDQRATAQLTLAHREPRGLHGIRRRRAYRVSDATPTASGQRSPTLWYTSLPQAIVTTLPPPS